MTFGFILWIGWIYACYNGFANRRFTLSAIVLIGGIAVNHTAVGRLLGIAAKPLWAGLIVILLIVNQFDSSKRGAV